MLGFLAHGFPAHVLVILMIGVLPWLGQQRYRSLQTAVTAGNSIARTRAYWRTIWAKNVLVLAAGVAAALMGATREDLGIRWPAAGFTSGIWTWVWLCLLAGYLGSSLYFRAKGGPQIRTIIKTAGAMLPGTSRERWLFALVAISAGVTEEFLYRGFLFFYLRTYLPPEAGTAAVLGVFLIAFGVIHFYQRWEGVVLTTMVGAWFGWLYILTQSLLVPAAMHALLDLRILLVITPERLREERLDKPRPIEG